MDDTRWLVDCSSVADIRRAIIAWISFPALRNLLTAFASSNADWSLIAALRDEVGTVNDRLDSLEHFSDRWDTRNNDERHKGRTLSLTKLQVQALGAVLADVGMQDRAEPLFYQYDHVLILGGMVGACLVRTDHAAGLMSSRLIQTDSVVGLGSYRALVEEERALARFLGIEDESDEYNFLDSVIRKKFFLHTARFHVERVGTGADRSAEVGTYLRPDGLRAMVVAAPSSDPGVRRANTGDTYSFVAKRLLNCSARPHPRLLIISSPLNRLYQHAEAVRLLALPYGMQVDTIACKEHGRQHHDFDANMASECLMELRSTIRAIRMLASTLLRLPA